MQIQHLTAEQLNLKPAGSEKNPEAMLHGQLILAGCTCHVEAYEVHEAENNGQLFAVDVEYEDAVTALYELSNTSSPLSTATINGRKYVITVFPHAS